MTKPAKPDRRSTVLSKDRIVAEAIALLDSEGENALTFRALAARLATGSGAIYWHVADKDALLEAATDDLIARAMNGVTGTPKPDDAIRAIALGLFDTIEAHPWVGSRLSREPWQPAVGQVFEAIGQQLIHLGVPETAQFDCASALVNYILGAAGQTAAAARLIPRDTDRTTVLTGISARWTRGNPAAYPFVQRIGAQLRDHDDRAQFLAGIDLILAGISTLK